MIALRLGLHYLGQNNPSSTGSRGSIVFVTSTSGYFGSTGNAAYISSKHGVVGLMRASLRRAAFLGISLSSVAPCYTPTHLTAGFGQKITDAGLDANTPEGVASVVASLACDGTAHGLACLVSFHLFVYGRPWRSNSRSRSGGVTSGSWNAHDRTCWIVGLVTTWWTR